MCWHPFLRLLGLQCSISGIPHTHPILSSRISRGAIESIVGDRTFDTRSSGAIGCSNIRTVIFHPALPGSPYPTDRASTSFRDAAAYGCVIDVA
jgi:hypothetical protein